MKQKITTRGIELLLKMSGAFTSIVVLFVTFFLFKESAGLFSTPAIEGGHGLYVNSSNHISTLKPEEVKHIFDGELENWKSITGKDEAITLMRIDDVVNKYTDEELGTDYSNLPKLLAKEIAENEGVIAYLPTEFAPSKSEHVKVLTLPNHTLKDFFFGKEWLPTATPSPLFEALPLILGTLWVSLMAIIIALPLGLGVAIYMSELATNRTRKIMKPIIELLAGIPSVVYGFFGLVVIAPLVQKWFHLQVGETAITGSIVLAIMALPTIISVAEDALRNTPRSMREASLALGANQWQTIARVVVPYAKSGIMASIVLGIGRAIGETMAVLMVTGNAAVIPGSPFDSVRTIPATIAAELGEAPAGGAHYQALFLLGAILFSITMVISILAEMINKSKHKLS